MIKRNLYLTGVLLLVSIATHAQMLPLSLEEAWQLSFRHYPEFAEREAQVRTSEYQKQIVKSKYLPQLQLQLQNTYGTHAGSAGSFFPLPGIFNVNSNARAEEQANATTSFYGSAVVDWRLFEFGRRSKALEAATYQEEAAKSSFDVTQLTVQAQVSRLYVAVLYNQANFNWAKQNASRLQEILTLSISMTGAGLKPGADSLFALSAYQQALGESNSWQGKLVASKVQLTELVPLSPDSIHISSPAYLAATVVPIIQSSAAERGHPYLEVLHQQVNLANSQQGLAERQAFPALSFLGGVSSRGSGIGADGVVGESWDAGFDNMANNYLVGFGLTWDLTSAYRSGLESKEATQKVKAAQARYDKQAMQLSTTFQAVEANMQEQLKQISTTEKAVANARSAYELYLSRYESGLISMTELLQLQFLLQQAEKAGIEAHQQYWNQVILQAEVSGDFTYLSDQF